MNKGEFEEQIITAVNRCANEQGWANLAEVGAKLREQGIKYGKLSKFLRDYEYLVEMRSDTNRVPPVAYARLLH